MAQRYTDDELHVDRHGVPAGETLLVDKMPPTCTKAELRELIGHAPSLRGKEKTATLPLTPRWLRCRASTAAVRVAAPQSIREHGHASRASKAVPN